MSTMPLSNTADPANTHALRRCPKTPPRRERLPVRSSPPPTASHRIGGHDIPEQVIHVGRDQREECQPCPPRHVTCETSNAARSIHRQLASTSGAARPSRSKDARERQNRAQLTDQRLTQHDESDQLTAAERSRTSPIKRSCTDPAVSGDPAVDRATAAALANARTEARLSRRVNADRRKRMEIQYTRTGTVYSDSACEALAF